MSNTDKLQEIKQRWDEGRGLISTDAIEYLISQLEQAQVETKRLKEEVEQGRRIANELVRWHMNCTKENEQLKADNQKLVGVIEWYGDKKNHEKQWADGLMISDYDNDYGKRARKVLKEVKGDG